jgi:DNA-binding transcriptional MocR family regulator
MTLGSGVPRRQPIIRTLVAEFESRIAMLPNQSRLPSVRRQAKMLGVSPSTVVELYERLAAKGLVTSKPGVGSFTSQPISSGECPIKLPVAESRLHYAPQADARIRNLGGGCLSLDLRGAEQLRPALRAISRNSLNDLAQYDEVQGRIGLRSLLAERLAALNVPATANSIMVTESASKALDLLFRALLKPGDTVLLDDPTSFNFTDIARLYSLRLVTLPFGPAGRDIAALERILHTERPKLYLTVSALHNPTGLCLSLPEAFDILSLAKAHDMLIIEDDVYSDLEDTPSPRLSALDGFKQTIYISSFSKTISAAVRCGFIAANAETIAAVTNLQQAATFGGAAISSQIIESILAEGGYRKWTKTLREKLAMRRRRAVDELRDLGFRLDHVPDAGMFLWAAAPEGLSPDALIAAAADHKLALSHSSAFSIGRRFPQHFRFNASHLCGPSVFADLRSALQTATAARLQASASRSKSLDPVGV